MIPINTPGVTLTMLAIKTHSLNDLYSAKVAGHLTDFGLLWLIKRVGHTGVSLHTAATLRQYSGSGDCAVSRQYFVITEKEYNG